MKKLIVVIIVLCVTVVAGCGKQVQVLNGKVDILSNNTFGMNCTSIIGPSLKIAEEQESYTCIVEITRDTKVKDTLGQGMSLAQIQSGDEVSVTLPERVELSKNNLQVVAQEIVVMSK